MFVVDRSALAVLLPLALLVTVVLWSNRPSDPPAPQTAQVEQDTRRDLQVERDDRPQTVAANLPSR